MQLWPDWHPKAWANVIPSNIFIAMTRARPYLEHVINSKLSRLTPENRAICIRDWSLITGGGDIKREGGGEGACEVLPL